MSRVFWTCIALVCSLTTVSCDEDQRKSKSYTSSSSSSQTLSSGNGFTVSAAETSVNGRCVARMVIHGNGIYKIIDFSCRRRPLSVINLDQKLLVADEFYSESPGVVVRLHGGRCDREVFQYQRAANRYSSTVTAVPPGECDRIKGRVAGLKETQRRWDEWYRKRQQGVQQQLVQVQSGLASLQQQFFSSLFGSEEFGGFG